MEYSYTRIPLSKKFQNDVSLWTVRSSSKGNYGLRIYSMLYVYAWMIHLIYTCIYVNISLYPHDHRKQKEKDIGDR